MTYYAQGMAWEAFYKPDGYCPTEKAFPTQKEAADYCEQMEQEHPEAHWSVSTRSIHDRGCPYGQG